MECLVKQNTHLELSKQLFALYLYEGNPGVPDFLVQFGGYDLKYAEEMSSEIVWLERLPEKGYYWMVEMEALYVRQQGQGVVNTEDMIEVAGRQALLTINSQWLELPREELRQFVAQMARLGGEVECMVVDEELLMVYCKHLRQPEHFDALALVLRFQAGTRVEHVHLNSSMLYRSCRKDDDTQLLDCQLNVKYSPSEVVILGEPFMKSHYAIFVNQPDNSQKVGILPAATEIYEDEHFEREWPLYRFVVATFALGLLAICCGPQLRRCVKTGIRLWSYARANVQFHDEGSLRVKNPEAEDFSDDVDEDYYSKKKQLEEEQRTTAQALEFSGL